MNERKRKRGMGVVNNTPMNSESKSETSSVPAPGVRSSPRFQVIVEYAAGVCLPSAASDSAEEAVEAFMQQSPGCEEGEIALFDRHDQRVVASVKWKMSGTEIGLRVPHRHNIFHDWCLALIACERLQKKAFKAGCPLV